MKVFLDTNVLVSAFTTRGLCHDLFRLVLAEHEFVCGEVILGELREVLSERFKMPAGTVTDIIRLLRSYPIAQRPATTMPNIKVRDSDDAWVLASAFASKAQVLITGDQDLLTSGTLPGLRIADPRGFWTLVKGAP